MSLTQVVECRSGSFEEKLLNLEQSSVALHYGLSSMSICYYYEADASTTFTGMTNRDGSLRVFVKMNMEHGIVDLSLEEWHKQWNLFPELIPLEV